MIELPVYCINAWSWLCHKPALGYQRLRIRKHPPSNRHPALDLWECRGVTAGCRFWPFLLSFVYSKVMFPLLRPTKKHPRVSWALQKSRKSSAAARASSTHTRCLSSRTQRCRSWIYCLCLQCRSDSSTSTRTSTRTVDHQSPPEAKKWKEVNLPHLPSQMAESCTGQGMVWPRAVEKKRRRVSDHWVEYPHPSCSQTSLWPRLWAGDTPPHLQQRQMSKT